MTNTAIAIIARIITDHDLNPSLIPDLRPALTPDAYESLALAFDLCPIHDCDLDSCRDDDDAECMQFHN